jgi:hypothetical protein
MSTLRSLAVILATILGSAAFGERQRFCAMPPGARTLALTEAPVTWRDPFAAYSRLVRDHSAC